ncbi:LPD28 domain-containing protein, partial [Bacteroides gallinaceum]|uniref:LPD28 domain-containing protein n=1 Tax=Bacteroides gallinaceum TaxID=1462571 RepID=UPI0019561A0A
MHKLDDGVTMKGVYLDLRITSETIPAGKLWYQIRHCDNDWTEPATLKKGCVVVNFMGTFVSDPIEGLEEWGNEAEI